MWSVPWWGTPQKSNIDNKHGHILKGVHLFQTIILGIHVSFRDVTFQITVDVPNLHPDQPPGREAHRANGAFQHGPMPRRWRRNAFQTTLGSDSTVLLVRVSKESNMFCPIWSRRVIIFQSLSEYPFLPRISVAQNRMKWTLFATLPEENGIEFYIWSYWWMMAGFPQNRS